MRNYKDEIKRRLSDDADRENILAMLEQFHATSDRGELRGLADELFPYEKKYMQRYEGDCDTLICTVGMQKAPIILSFIAMQPKRGILLHTDGSEKVADEVIRDNVVASLDIRFNKIEIDEVDAAENYRILKDNVLKRLRGGVVRVDPTGGRKIMGTAVGAFAFFFRIPMIYLHAEEKMGISVPFTGKIRDIENPYEYYGDIELSLLKRHFDNYEFDSALRVCEELRERVKDPNLYVKLEVISDLIEVYRDWDAFLHSKHYARVADRDDNTKLEKRLEDINTKIERFKLNVVETDYLHNNIKFLQQLDACWVNKKNICDEYRLVDLYLNANRRAELGKYDDATARLYRCMEMCSTVELLKFGIGDVGKPDYDTFASTIGYDVESLSVEFEKEANYGLPKMLALNNQMILLKIIGVSVAKIYFGLKNTNDNTESVMDKRNRSILAHGTNVIIDVDYKIMESRTRSIISTTIGNDEFKQLEKQAKFPKMMI